MDRAVNSLDPVSYTHLDVYKRQILYRHLYGLHIRVRARVCLQFLYIYINVQYVCVFQTIYQVDSLFYLRVKVSAFESRPGPKQCYNCQRYGRSSIYCHFHNHFHCREEVEWNGSRLSMFPLRKQAAPADDSRAYPTPFRTSRNERLRTSRIEGSPDTENYPQAQLNTTQTAQHSETKTLPHRLNITV